MRVLISNVADKLEFLKPLCSMLRSHKVQEAKMADFWPFSRPACSLKTAHPSRTVYNVFQCTGAVALLLPPFYGCAPYTVQGRVQQSVSHCFVLVSSCRRQQKTRATLLAATMRVQYLHSLQDLLVVFSYLEAFNVVTKITLHVELEKSSTSIITQSAQPSRQHKSHNFRMFSSPDENFTSVFIIHKLTSR